MCGFAGYFINGYGGNREAVIRAMADRIVHRGPDQADYYVDDDIALGFRRLSIIDLEGGSQPIENEDGSMVLTFNGEIYNYRPLREELLAAGHTFRTKTDSEVLLHGYEEWGAALLDRLRGMFAFVIWDKREKKLFGARDIFGIKPFYYYQNGGDFFFGSEIKSFLSHPSFVKELDETKLPDWLCYEYLPMRETFFKNVFKLLNGEYLEYQNGTLTIHKYYDAAEHFAADESISAEEWERRITEEFRESVQVHQISDVEVGCFLSGGVDSSYVVNEVMKGNDRVRTFSVGYAEEKYSELGHAQEFSRVIGVENIANKVSAEEYFDWAGKIQYYMDEPLPNPSEVPLFFLAQNAAKYVKVVLSGEGADELFGGYPMYVEGGHFAKYSRIPRLLRRGLAAVAKRLPDRVKGKRFAIRGAMKPYERFMRANYVFTRDERMKYLKNPGTPCDPVELSRPHFERVAALDEPTQLQYVDMQTWMLYDILQKADRMSMANSLELRVPFLDRKMLELALTLPTQHRIRGNTTKVALRTAALRQLPECTANRPKCGFPVPLNDWLRQDRYYERVRTAFEGNIADKFFNREAILALLEEHKQGRALNMKKIWTIYTFILWYEQFFVLN